MIEYNDIKQLEDRYGFPMISQPIGGIVGNVVPLSEELGSPEFEIFSAHLDDLAHTFSHMARNADGLRDPVTGTAADVNRAMALLRALSEAAERYASMAYTADDFIVASASELGQSALDFGAIPRCSQNEYSDPLCPLTPPDSSQPIRWVKGYSLLDERERFVPAIMVFLSVIPMDGERFWIPISTGTAAHVDLASAVVSAICEIIERDAVALTWLARLPLPRILIDTSSTVLEDHLDRLNDSLGRQYFFDATTDLGVPTVYSVHLVDRHPSVAQVVACATHFDPAAAVAKCIQEAAQIRLAVNRPYNHPENVQDFVALEDGAHYLGSLERRNAFRFLLDSEHVKPLSALTVHDPSESEERLRVLVRHMRALDMDCILVDVTPNELRDRRLWVVRVVIPALMPMSPVYRARFLGHPRLYEYPRRAGFGSLTEDQVNMDPQPFA